jgi:hypothetical protein
VSGLTVPNGIAYPTGTDKPCDSPPIWCAGAATLDAALTSVSNSLKRMTPAVPAAKLVLSGAQFTPLANSTFFSGFIQFEGAEYDTDDMIDMARSSYDIRPRRAGWYGFAAWMAVQCSVASPSTVDMTVFTADQTTASTGADVSVDRQVSQGVGVVLYAKIVGSTRVAVVDPNRQGFTLRYAPQGTSVGAIVTDAALSVWWERDL